MRIERNSVHLSDMLVQTGVFYARPIDIVDDNLTVGRCCSHSSVKLSMRPFNIICCQLVLVRRRYCSSWVVAGRGMGYDGRAEVEIFHTRRSKHLNGLQDISSCQNGMRSRRRYIKRSDRNACIVSRYFRWQRTATDVSSVIEDFDTIIQSQRVCDDKRSPRTPPIAWCSGGHTGIGWTVSIRTRRPRAMDEGLRKSDQCICCSAAILLVLLRR